MNPANNLILVGPMGSGKTSIGRRLAELLDLAFVDADRDIELRTGAAVGTIFDCEGEDGFRARERAAIAELLATDGQVIATGGGAVLDAGNRERMRQRGFVVHLDVAVEVQLQRLARDRVRPLLQREDREQVLRELSVRRAPLYAEVADLRFDTDGMTTTEAAAGLLHVLQERWQRGGMAA
ncbi:MAG: aroK [Xanthomonadaceae bacterium]|nr:aroK [Xanthomonadaceae bacterium]